ncbi:MAG: LLM class flavin-dependent oxidoreductase [Actinomycetota bacterium]
MKLGIGLPNTLTPDVNRGLFLDWARVSDHAGFHVFGTLDQPNYDSWDPLVSLAAAAAVTERVRLATTILQLPNRNEVLVAKQSAVIDRLSGGRLDLGVAVGGREDDFKVFGARFAGRGAKLERQVRKIRKTWRAARRSTPEEGITGPAPMQKPLPPIWIGGSSDRAVARAVSIGDGYVFGAAGPEAMAARAPAIRAAAAEAGRKQFGLMGIAYVAIAEDPTDALEQATRALTRYYRGNFHRPPRELVHHGPAEIVAQAAKEYEQAGLDVLVLLPLIPSLKQVEAIAAEVLPAYRVPAH